MNDLGAEMVIDGGGGKGWRTRPRPSFVGVGGRKHAGALPSQSYKYCKTDKNEFWGSDHEPTCICQNGFLV